MAKTFAEISQPVWSSGKAGTFDTPEDSDQGAGEAELFEEAIGVDKRVDRGDGELDGDKEGAEEDPEQSPCHSAVNEPEIDQNLDQKTGAFLPPPDRSATHLALTDVMSILSPKRKSGLGHNPFKEDELLRKRLQMVKMMLWTYTDKSQPLNWIAASLKTANSFQTSMHIAKQIRKWACSFMDD